MKKYYPYIILISAVVFFLPFLGFVHLFDWDEINFAESAREMIVTGNYSRVQIDFLPFWEKPPFFFWLQALSMNIFGIGELAARLPNAIFGIVTLLSFFFIGRKLKDEKFGFIWALAYLGSFLPHLYFKSGIIDPLYNYFIFLSVYFIAVSIQTSTSNSKHQTPNTKLKTTNYELQTTNYLYSIIGGAALGLAVLTKGPVAILIIFLTFFSWWAASRFRPVLGFRFILIYIASAFIIASLWFGLEVFHNGIWFIREFISYQIALFLTPVAGHAEPFYYHFLIVFIGCFPLSVLAVPVLFSRKTYEPSSASDSNAHVFKFMLILFWVVMILFSIVKTKIVHYSSLAYFPLSYLAASYIHDVITRRVVISKYIVILIAVIGSLFSILLIALPIIAYNKNILIPYLKDPFAVDCLSTAVSWSGYEFLIGLGYLLAVMFSVFLITRHKLSASFLLLFYSTALCLFIYLISVVPKIEGYSQAPAVNFYKSIAGKDVYVEPYGFKSYAQYFYFRKMPSDNKNSSNMDWLLNGQIDKPVYFITKSTNHDLDKHPDCKLMERKGGFVFYIRLPQNNSK